MMLGKDIALKSCVNNKYLSILNEGKISFSQNDIKNCDILTMRYVGKYITLKDKNGKYITCNLYNTLELSKDIFGDNEKFEIEWIDENLFSLKAINGCYISVQTDGKVELNKKDVNINEQLNMIVKKEESLLEFLSFLKDMSMY